METIKLKALLGAVRRLQSDGISYKVALACMTKTYCLQYRRVIERELEELFEVEHYDHINRLMNKHITTKYFTGDP